MLVFVFGEDRPLLLRAGDTEIRLEMRHLWRPGAKAAPYSAPKLHQFAITHI